MLLLAILFVFLGATGFKNAGAVVATLAATLASGGTGFAKLAISFGAMMVMFPLGRFGRTGPTFVIAVAIILAVISSTFAFADLSKLVPSERGILLYFGILPLLNAAFDSLSYAVTLALTQRGLRMGAGAVVLGVFDAFIAGLLFLALGGALVAVVALMNRFGGVVFIDIDQVLSEITNWREYWWLYAMAFSTAIPTVLHFGIALLALQAILPSAFRLWIVRQIELRDESADSAALAPMMLGAVWFMSLGFPSALLALMVWFCRDPLETFGAFYLEWLSSVATFF